MEQDTIHLDPDISRVPFGPLHNWKPAGSSGIRSAMPVVGRRTGIRALMMRGHQAVYGRCHRLVRISLVNRLLWPGKPDTDVDNTPPGVPAVRPSGAGIRPRTELIIEKQQPVSLFLSMPGMMAGGEAKTRLKKQVPGGRESAFLHFFPVGRFQWEGLNAVGSLAKSGLAEYRHYSKRAWRYQTIFREGGPSQEQKDSWNFGYICNMDVLTKEQRRKNMQAIRSEGTKAEILLAKALWHKGHRYRKNDKTVFGKPDLTFKRYKLAVFVDSEYFHGKDWETEKYRIKTNRDFWWTKIEGNIARDRRVNEELEKAGWKILRFWSKQVSKELTSCVNTIEYNLR